MNSEVTANVTLKEQEKYEALKLFEGSSVTFTGILNDDHPRSGMRSISLDHGTIE